MKVIIGVIIVAVLLLIFGKFKNICKYSFPSSEMFRRTVIDCKYLYELQFPL